MTWQCTILDNKEDDICNLHRDLGDMMHDVTVLGQISTLISSLKMSHEVSRPLSLSLSLSLSQKNPLSYGNIFCTLYSYTMVWNLQFMLFIKDENDDTRFLFHQQNIPTVYNEVNYI